MKTFFTSDTHFGHDAIRRNCSRPFRTVQEMDRAMIANWNACVGPNDVVYHLGDFSYKASHSLENYRRKLNGEIHLVRGNHDSEEPGVLESVFDSVHDLVSITVSGQRIVLCHYAMKVWDRRHRGSWQLYGHSHGKLLDDPESLSLDVGVDCWGYKPLSFEELKMAMDCKQGA